MPEHAPSLPVLYTIGHSNHEFPAFASMLRRHGVACVVDVRSVPQSRWRPHFGREKLTKLLAAERIEYRFLGRELGARREEPEAYEGPRASYELIAGLPLFQQGLDRVEREGATRPVALMCAEKDPLTCHRTILICRHLRDRFDIRHILPGGAAGESEIETNGAAEERLLKMTGVGAPALFGSRPESVLQAYRLQGERIAYSRER
jgi:uncharacterized protein (DUF488 family)